MNKASKGQEVLYLASFLKTNFMNLANYIHKIACFILWDADHLWHSYEIYWAYFLSQHLTEGVLWVIANIFHNWHKYDPTLGLEPQELATGEMSTSWVLLSVQNTADGITISFSILWYCQWILLFLSAYNMILSVDSFQSQKIVV